MNDGPLRVAVWTTGNVVRQAVRAIARRDDLVLVAGFTRTADKVGRDLGRLCGLDRDLGVAMTDDLGAVIATRPDAVVYSPLFFDVDDAATLLRSGVNVVTSAELMTGTNLGDASRAALLEAAREGGATLFGSGMNPGFAQLLAAVGTGITSGVERVRVSESVDVSQFVSDANFEAVGWGRPRDDPGHADDIRAGMRVFAEAVEVLAELLRAPLDAIRCDVELAHATQDVEVPGLTIRADHVAAMDVNWVGVVAGRDAIEVRQRWLATEHLDTSWTAEHGYIVEVTGDPNVRLRLDIWPTDDDLAHLDKEVMHGIGMRITAVPVVNAIPAVCRAAPGIATYADLPVVTSPLRAG